MQHFANFGIVKKANKQLKNIYESKTGGVHPNNYANPNKLGEISSTAARTASRYPNDAEESITYAKEILSRGKADARYLRARNNRDPLTRNYGDKPFFKAKNRNEDYEFSPSTNQLNQTLNRHYPEYKNYVNHPRDLLVTGSDNHTWLTNDGKYMEMPIGQESMPLNASMWKGLKTGVRLPARDVLNKGAIGSPKSPLTKKDAMRTRFDEYTDEYNSQVTNKRYVPTE
jgi:hypothetical protein